LIRKVIILLATDQIHHRVFGHLSDEKPVVGVKTPPPPAGRQATRKKAKKKRGAKRKDR